MFYEFTEKSITGIAKRIALHSYRTSSGCLIWNAAIVRGYPVTTLYIPGKNGTRYKKKTAKVHRLSLEIRLGRRLDSSEFACHTCDNKSCIEPTHLYPGNNSQNMRDRSARTWRQSGETCPMAKLTNKQAVNIRNSKEPTKILAKKFNVSGPTITRIRAGTTWKNIK